MTPVRVLQVSDLHAGTREERRSGERPAGARSPTSSPELVVASGDLTHRRHARAARARAPISCAPSARPLLVDPREPRHPATAFRGALHENVRRVRAGTGQTTEPAHAAPSGSLRRAASTRCAPGPPAGRRSARVAARPRSRAVRLGAARGRATAIVVLHHHLLGAPWRVPARSPIADSGDACSRALVDAGAELILAGPHPPERAVSERHEFEVVEGDVAPARSSSIAPGLGQPRPEPARRSARPALLRGRRELADSDHVLLGGKRLVPHRRAPLRREASVGLRRVSSRSSTRGNGGQGSILGWRRLLVAMARRGAGAAAGDEADDLTPPRCRRTSSVRGRLGDKRNRSRRRVRRRAALRMHVRTSSRRG